MPLRSLLRLVLPVVLLVAAPACGGGDSPGETRVLGAQVERGTVAGVVRRAGVPVVGGRVTLGDRQVATDAAGAYRFDGVAPGTYRLVAIDPGDDTPTCDANGACVSGRSSTQAEVEVVVPDRGGAVPVDVDL